MAQCPLCTDAPLVHTMLTEGLAGYGCGRCLGTLVSLVSYRAWRECAGRALRPEAAPAMRDLDAADTVGAKACPKCRSLMSKYRISAERSNRLDYCAHCEEVWLDDGEWQLVESVVTSGEFAKVFTQVWQQGVRTGVSRAMEALRLRELLGQDHERVEQFANWLRDHPAKHEILAQLARPVR